MGKTIMDHPMTKALIKIFRKDLKLEVRKMKEFTELYVSDKLKKFSKNIIKNPILSKEKVISGLHQDKSKLEKLNPPKSKKSKSNDKQIIMNELKEVLKSRYIEQ